MQETTSARATRTTDQKPVSAGVCKRICKRGGQPVLHLKRGDQLRAVARGGQPVGEVFRRQLRRRGREQPPVPGLGPTVAADLQDGDPEQPRPGVGSRGVVASPDPERGEKRLGRDVLGEIRPQTAMGLAQYLIGMPVEYGRERDRIADRPGDELGIARLRGPDRGRGSRRDFTRGRMPGVAQFRGPG
jgi:hypothetical protein